MGERQDNVAARTATAIWYAARGVVELRSSVLPAPAPSEARVRMLYSGISRGTERLVLEGQVPESERQRMRAPLQQGEFPFPVKYGYCAVGVVEAGPVDLIGRNVFCLHPHQDVFLAPATLLVPVPAAVPAARATLAANMETALNALWDSGAGPADRILVVGAGLVGLLVGFLAARLPGTDVTVTDTNASRRHLIERLGCRYAAPPAVTAAAADVVFHASATAAGLATAIDAAGQEARIVELSWYGEASVLVPLGGAFHSRRLTLASSQVGHVSPARRPRWDHRRRLAAALALLADPRLDELVREEIDFRSAPAALPAILSASNPALAPIIRYPQP